MISFYDMGSISDACGTAPEYQGDASRTGLLVATAVLMGSKACSEVSKVGRLQKEIKGGGFFFLD